ncbi:MerR family transcriptional regulator [Ruminococcus sp.]|uniref:MerR family transcriptional regulator n=1 Tax=Ruminococcus sp. TaxID=41978 RepID=UPI002E768077|nr:MerR family transcriptional regulator [Ruminococcus sp.]MEE1264460.1 MerR family transcriptional regulator [Ruminococcus sp.]
MKMQIKEFAELTGVSVRTLHYYDEIGLLKPSEVDAQNGYRFYDERSLERMQEILFYRELDFSLKTIAQILSSPDYDKQQALTRQRKLLLAKKERLERLIDALDSMEKGEGFMKPNNEYEDLKNKYAEEVRQRWGSTDAYKESQQRNTDFSQAASLLDAVFEEFAELDRSGTSPDDEAAKIQVEKLQRCITDNFYTCTNEILAGLGQMYVADVRFKNYIDKHGEGTAEFVSQCIKSYCK